ncbi:MAG: hypothetical protein H7061_11385 [Bdellovibrionaceae bacterium]|nr:hypothetical protein [Bdellovibrio sp.]
MRANILLFTSLTVLSFSLYAVDQQSTETLTMKAPPVTATVPTPSLLLGFKSYNDTGRFGTINDAKGQTYSGKQEAFLGYRFQSGWGGFVQATQYRYQYNDSTLNKWSASDTSVTLIHPDIYNDGTFKVIGTVRAYIPQTDRSKSKNIRQYAYYSTQLYAFAKGHDLFNQIIPRFFVADRYSDADTTFYIEDRTVYTEKLATWARWGIGNWFQYEKHSATIAGYSDEIIPQFDFILNSNFYFGPRLSLPVFTQNSVYDAPKNATWDQARAELFLQVTL